ncbi:MAG: hypothetical protein AAF468_06305 [Pseudomonadota bacterium]
MLNYDAVVPLQKPKALELADGLSAQQRSLIAGLWQNGKDTHAIARLMRLPESVVSVVVREQREARLASQQNQRSLG